MPKLAISHQLKRQRLGPQQRRAQGSGRIMTATTATGNHHSNTISSLHRNQQQQPNSISSNTSSREPMTGAALDQPADCTIACDKGHITAHKLVLCQHSKYLQDILSKFPQAEHPIVILTELDIIDIKVLVNYMYTGALDITSDTSPTSLLRAAQILKIDSLTAANDDDGDQDLVHHSDDVDGIDDEDDDVDLLDGHGDNDLVNHHHHHQLHQQQDDQDDDVDLLDDVGHDDDDVDGDDDDDDVIDQEDDAADDVDNVDVDLSKLMMNQHAINSIKNIYGFLDATKTTPPSPSLLAQAIGQNNNNSNNNGNHNSNTNTTNSNMPSPNGNINNNNNNSSHHNLHHDLQEVMAAQKGGLSGFGALSSLVDNKNNKIRCHLCNIGLSDVKCLYRHVLTRHLPEKWGYKCEFCDREFSRDDHLMRHYTTKHKKMEFNREKIRETRRLNREMAKNFHDTVSTTL